MREPGDEQPEPTGIEPCREFHADRESAMECVRRRAAERAASRSTDWGEQLDAAMAAAKHLAKGQ